MGIKKLSLLAVIFAGLLLGLQCMKSEKHTDPRGESYAGSATCVKCHQSVSSSYLHTAHYMSASVATATSIAGSFAKDSCSFIVNDTTKVVMEKRNGLFYQVLYINNKEAEAHSLDIVFGNLKGQTYLTWKHDLLYQLPVSYFAALHTWTGSPGYSMDQINFTRPIVARCFECHTSYIKQLPVESPGNPMPNAFDKSTLIYNIDCERCHGPAAAHVKFQETNPEQKEAKYIASFKSLSRAQKIDMCAVCHSGNKNFMLRSTFEFKPGDTLSRFMDQGITNSESVDVHGNQAQLLAKSKCFITSNMDCSSCHNTHINDRGNYKLYAQKCMACHSEANHNFCKTADVSNMAFIKNNCTKCHMPAQPSKAIVVESSETGMSVASSVVNHHIAVYPVESGQVFKTFKTK